MTDHETIAVAVSYPEFARPLCAFGIT